MEKTAEDKQRIHQFDFIKGLAIIAVLFDHTNPPIKAYYHYTMGQIMPMFIIVSYLLCNMSLSKDDSIRNYFKPKRVKNFFSRIFLPFIFAQIVIVIIYVILNKFSLRFFIQTGGYGPGTHFPWSYLQLWVIMPFLYYLMKKNFFFGFFVSLIISVAVNIVCSIFSSPELLPFSFVHINKTTIYAMYRLCASRYLFLFPFVYLLFEKKIKYKYLIPLGVLSAAYIYISGCTNISLEPFVYNSDYAYGTWQIMEYPSVFFSILVFIFLYKIYDFIPNIIQKVINKIGEKSWEIFCVQVVYYAMVERQNMNYLLYVIISLLVCILSVFMYDFMKKQLGKKTTRGS